MQVFLWGAMPYIALVSLIGGLWWRYRYDKFGWTTRSSEPYESRLLNIASPLFHYGILFVLVGHLMGLFVPDSWTTALGLSEHGYHLLSLIGGTIAGVLAVAGIVLLIFRRRTNVPVFRATTRNDKVMYLFLLSAILLGLYAKLTHSTLSHGYDYRTTIAPWARGVFLLDPRPELWQTVPVAYRIHAVVGMLLIALVPFTRLVHMFSAPIQYLFRPYIVYRYRDQKRPAGRTARRGWDPVGD